MVEGGSFLDAVAPKTHTREMGYIIVDEDDTTVRHENEKSPEHNNTVTNTQGAFLNLAAQHRCRIWFLRFCSMMSQDMLQCLHEETEKEKKSGTFTLPDRFEYDLSHSKMPSAEVTVIRKSESNPFGHSYPDFEDSLKKSGLNDFVIMGFHTNACVKATAVGPFYGFKGCEDWEKGTTMVLPKCTIWTCKLGLRGDQGEADWKGHPQVKFYTAI